MNVSPKSEFSSLTMTESRAADWEHQLNSPVMATSEFDDNLDHHTMLSAMSIQFLS